MSNAHLGWSVSDAEVHKSFQKMQADVERLQGKLAGAGDASKKASKEGETGMQKWAQQTREAISGYDLMGNAISGVVDQLRQQLALQEKIAGTQKTAADSERAFLRNLGNVSPAERDQARAEIRRIAAATGVKQADLFTAASTAMSARGALSPMEALKSVEMAARVAPESPGELTSFAGALLDVQALTKSQDQEANLGFMVAMQSQARATSLTQVAQNLVPGAIGVQGFGGTPGEAAARVTTLSQAMKDPTGAISGTAGISLAEQLEKFEPLKDLKETDDRIRFLQANESVREEFLKKASFEKKAVIPIRELLTPGSETAQLFERNIRGFPTAAAAQDEARRFVTGIGDTPLQRAADLQRRAEQEIEDYDLTDFRSGDAARIRKRVNDLLDRSGASYLSPGRQLFEFSQDPALMGERILAARGNALRGGTPEQDRLANLMEKAVEELKQARLEAAKRAGDEKQKQPPLKVDGSMPTK